MNRVIFFALSSLIVLSWLAGHTLAQDEVAQDEVDQLGDPEATASQRALVQQLGDPSFHARERAQEELSGQGVAAEAALTEALKSPDLEIRLRARKMLSRIRVNAFEARLASFIADVDGTRQLSLPAWKQFRDLVGDSRRAREMFAAMTRQDAPLLSAYENQLPELPQLHADRVAWMKSQASSGNSITRVDTRNLLATLLFIGCDDKVKDNSTRNIQLYVLLCQQGVVHSIGAESQSPILRVLLEEWVTSPALGNSYYGMSLALKFNLKETGLKHAMKLLDEGKTSSSILRYAVIVVGRFGGEEQTHLLTPLLENKTVCGRWTNRALKKNGTIDTQLRDVALVVLLRLRGKEPKQYGFKLLQENPETLYHSYTFGFVNDEEREAAHAKWAVESKTDKS